MTTCFLAPDPIQSTQFIPGGNTPANGALVFFYTAGSATKETVYKDNAAGTAWTNPIVLDSGGNLPSGGEVWFTSGVSYKAVFAPANDSDPPSSPYWTKDNLTGINDISALGLDEWLDGTTPSFISGTVFQVAGDQRTTYTANRRVRTNNTGGIGYATITSVTFTASNTNVGLSTTNSLSLDAGLSAVAYGFLNGVNQSVPALLGASILLTDPTIQSKALTVSVSSFTASTSRNINVQDISGTMALTSEFNYSTVAGPSGRLVLPMNYINGFKIANNATSTALDIGSGWASDSANTVNLLSTGLIGKNQAAFAVGASSGAKLSAPAMSSNAWYAWYALGGSSGAIDFGFDLAFPPAIPTTSLAFPVYRYIGARKTTASTTAWEQFYQHNDETFWKTLQALDIQHSNPGTNATTYRFVNLPPVACKGYMNVAVTNFDIPNSTTAYCYLSSLEGADQAPLGTDTPLASIATQSNNTTGVMTLSHPGLWFNSSSQIRSRMSYSNANTVVRLLATGWLDPRGKDS